MAMTVRSRRWDVRFDEGRSPRARIGFVLIPNEQTIEEDMQRWLPDGVGAHFSRAMMPREISTASLAELRQGLAAAAARILPDDGLDVICLACTSGTVAVGEAAAIAELNKGAPKARATTLAGSVRQALHAVGARRIAVATPYQDELNGEVGRYLREAGFEIAAIEGLNLKYDTEMIRVAPDFIVEFARAVDTPEADAVLISCGALRSIDIVEQAETLIGKPVICSNQAMLWNCLRLAGIGDRLNGLGRLLREH